MASQSGKGDGVAGDLGRNDNFAGDAVAGDLITGDLQTIDRGTTAAGCVIALASALATSILLFLNGALVLAVLTAFADRGPAWVSNPQLMQFCLFTLPVVLVVAQWMMIDYLRTRLIRRQA